MTLESSESLLEEKSTSYLELFFDLVFVFAVTQVSALVHQDQTFAGLGRGSLLLLLLWWTWSLYTWTTNWTGTDSLGIKLSLMGAMAAALVMSAAVADAFTTGGTWFALSYLIVRIFVAAMYWMGSRRSAAQRAALMTFLPLSLLAPFVVLTGAYFDGTQRLVIWVLAVVIDMLSAASAGRATWEIDAGHFAERNALFVMIALGESIVAIGIGATLTERQPQLVSSLVIAFAGAAVLWWSYFDRSARAAEEYLKNAEGQERGRFARDAYTILHLPIVIGIVLFAVAAEEVVAHPDRHLEPPIRFALVVGVGLVLLGIVAAAYRATHHIPYARMVAAMAVFLLAFFAGDLRADLLMATVVLIVGAALWQERLSPEREVM
jgi:low temperature requirement protein LtrA